MRFFWDNFIDAAATAISSATEDSVFIDDNVAEARKGKTYKTGTSQAAEWIKFDLGSFYNLNQVIDGFIVFNHTLDENDLAINIEGHTSDSWGSPDISEAISITSENETGVQKWESAQAKRWWRFEFTKQSAGDQISIGRIFLGDVYDTTADPDSGGYDEEVRDNSSHQKSIGGQSFSYIKEEFQRFKVTFRAISNSEMKQLRKIYRALGMHTPLFIQIDPSASDGVREVIQYVKFSAPFRPKVHSYDGELRWDLTLEFEEQI